MASRRCRGRMGRVLRWLVRGREHGLRARVFRGRAPAAVAAPPPPRASARDDFAWVVSAADLAPGQVMEAFVGEHALAVANVAGCFYAVSDVCPHAGGPLGDGTLEGPTLTCPFHGWSFDVTTGACHVDPALAVDIYEVDLRQGEVYVKLV